MLKWKQEDKVIKSLPKPGRELWVKVANAYVEEHGENQETVAAAMKCAWNAVKRSGYSKTESDHKWNLAEGSNVDQFTKDVFPYGGAPAELFKAEKKDGKRYITAKVSGLKVDRQDEKMLESAIQDMVQDAKDGKADLLDNHFSSFEMGTSVDGWTDDESNLYIKFEMNEQHPFTDQLYDEVESGTCKRQLSVGGNVTKARYEYDETVGKAVKLLEHVSLDHVAVTREGHAAYAEAGFVGAVCKQVHLQAPVKTPEGERSSKMKNRAELLKALQALGEQAAALLKGLFTITPDMLDGAVLKAEYTEQLKKAIPLPTEEENKTIAKALEPILKCLGVSVVKGSGSLKEKKEEEETEEDPEGKGKKKCKTTDGAVPPPTPGPGSATPTDGNGSAGAAKSDNAETLKGIGTGMVEQLRKQYEEKLKATSKQFEDLKKDTTADRSQLTRLLLEQQELKKQIEQLKGLPAVARVEPGNGQKIEKSSITMIEGMAITELLKSSNGDVLGFVKKLEKQVEQFVIMKKSGRNWTPEIQKEAEAKAQLLKDCKVFGAPIALGMHGIDISA